MLREHARACVRMRETGREHEKETWTHTARQRCLKNISEIFLQGRDGVGHKKERVSEKVRAIRWSIEAGASRHIKHHT